jgi:hypothetical protein
LLGAQQLGDISPRESVDLLDLKLLLESKPGHGTLRELLAPLNADETYCNSPFYEKKKKKKKSMYRPILSCTAVSHIFFL